MRRAMLHPHGGHVAGLVINLAMATSTDAPSLPIATISIAGDDAWSRCLAKVNCVLLLRPLP
jgi:hypothetical protein